MAFEKDGKRISFDCSEMIADLKQDILEFGENCEVYAVKHKGKNGVAWYIDYYYEINDVVDEQVKEDGDSLVKMTLGDLLPILIHQNEIL